MEEWKDIPGYEGRYKISTEGRVVSLHYRHSNREVVLDGRANDDGYLMVQLCKDNTRVFKTIHRLVATIFISNPDNKPCIDHINGDRKDNRVANLRWCTRKENSNFDLAKANYKKGHKGMNLGAKSACAKAVVQLSLEGRIIKRYPCIMDAHRETGITDSSISRVCRGERKQAGGFKWKFDV